MNKDQLQIRLSYWQRTLGMALIVTCFVLLAEFWSLTTHLAEYDRLYLGESSRDVDHTLAQAGIHCFDSTMPQGPQKCYFSDPWRDYIVTFDSRNGTVIRKVVIIRQPVTLLTRLANRFAAQEVNDPSNDRFRVDLSRGATRSP